MDIESTTLFVTEAHTGQYDKLGVPYVEHPKAVADILRISPSYFLLSDEDKHDAIIVALLHDILEDTTYSADDLLAKGYTSNVIYNVKLLTYDFKEGDRNFYYNKLKISDIARAVKVADIIHNNLPSRVQHLDVETRERLQKKYSNARNVLFTKDDNLFFDIKTTL